MKVPAATGGSTRVPGAPGRARPRPSADAHGGAAAHRSDQRDFANGHISASVLSRITW